MSEVEPFFKINDKDAEWLESQPISVYILWHQAARSNRFGSGWAPLKTNMKRSTFMKAKKIIEEYGAFKFEVRQGTKDARRTEGWAVFNMRMHNGKRIETKYQEFLLGDYWQDVRTQVLKRDGHKCQSCGSRKNLHVHHLTYEHHGEEHLHLDELQTLCSVCHAVEHESDT
jgi:hypothetical protein